jgi:hypothetical protein
MLRLSKKTGLGPSCFTIRGVTRVGEHPVAGGGFGDIWKGRFGGTNGHSVCLKVVKMYLMSDLEPLLKVRTNLPELIAMILTLLTLGLPPRSDHLATAQTSKPCSLSWALLSR